MRNQWQALLARTRGSQHMTAWMLLLFLALVWGSSFILIKRGLHTFSATQVGGLRLVIAGLCVVPLIWGQARKIRREEWKYILLVGVIGNALPAVLFPLAETRINSASAGIINVMSPIFVMIIGVLFFGSRFGSKQILGVILGLAGVLLLILLGEQSVDMGEHVLYAGLAVLATLGYGISTNVMKTHLGRIPANLAPGFALFFMAIPYGIYLLFFADLGTVFSKNATQAWQSLGYVALLGAIGTALALVLFYRLVQMTEAIIAASVTYLIPVVALFWGLVDGEIMTNWQYLGMLVIIFGVWMVNQRRKSS